MIFWLAKEIESFLHGQQHISWKGLVFAECKAGMHPRWQGSKVMPLNQGDWFLLDMTILGSTSSWIWRNRLEFASGADFEQVVSSIHIKKPYEFLSSQHRRAPI